MNGAAKERKERKRKSCGRHGGAFRGHAVVIPFGGARVGWSPWRGAHRAMTGGRFVSSWRPPPAARPASANLGRGQRMINDSVDSVDSIAVFSGGPEGGSAD
jgi:hypothetical protein